MWLMSRTGRRSSRQGSRDACPAYVTRAQLLSLSAGVYCARESQEPNSRKWKERYYRDKRLAGRQFDRLFHYVGQGRQLVFEVPCEGHVHRVALTRQKGQLAFLAHEYVFIQGELILAAMARTDLLGCPRFLRAWRRPEFRDQLLAAEAARAQRCILEYESAYESVLRAGDAERNLMGKGLASKVRHRTMRVIQALLPSLQLPESFNLRANKTSPFVDVSVGEAVDGSSAVMIRSVHPTGYYPVITWKLAVPLSWLIRVRRLPWVVVAGSLILDVLDVDEPALVVATRVLDGKLEAWQARLTGKSLLWVKEVS